MVEKEHHWLQFFTNYFAKITKKGAKMRPKIDLGAGVDFGCKKGMPPDSFWEPFWSKIHQQSGKNTFKTCRKNDTEQIEHMREKNLENGAKTRSTIVFFLKLREHYCEQSFSISK